MSIIETINDQEFCINAVTEYFGGKFSREEVAKLLYEYAPVPNGSLEVRRGVGKLAEEWNKLQTHDVKTVENWYSTTDFYIFDLLPWNACSMFTDKLDFIIQKLEQYGIKTLVDYGGGLGIASFYIRERMPETEILYVDFAQSHQYRFCSYLIKKLGITGVRQSSVNDFLSSDEWFDGVLAMDCFEHIPNMEETIAGISRHTNILIHDSTFGKNEAQPQHVNDHGDLWFANLMLGHSFIWDNDPKVYKRFRMVFDGRNIKMVTYAKEKNIYGT